MHGSVEKQKSYITMDALMTEGEKMGTQDILLVPRPTIDHLDALVQPLQPSFLAIASTDRGQWNRNALSVRDTPFWQH